MSENRISYLVRGAIYTVYNNLGPGLLESCYEAAVQYELEKAGLAVRRQTALPMIYQEVRIEAGYRLDLVVDNKVVIEIKSVEALQEVHHKQLLTYLRLSGFKLGILVNFNTANIAECIYRKVNGLEGMNANGINEAKPTNGFKVKSA